MRTVVNYKRFFVACIFLIISVIHCGNEYNPFEDNSNAQTHIISTLFKSDTIPIFTTDSVTLLFTVCKLIEKVSIQVKNNRHFDSMILDDICSTKVINFSFYDIGYQDVWIVTYRRNGDSSILKKTYYVTSDLKQDNINDYYGDTLHLYAKTNNLRQDKDIRYVWKIGSVETPPSSKNAIMIINEQVKNDSGELYMCDEKGTYHSPSFFFKVTLQDNRPRIVIDDGADSDTLYTSSDSIDLKIHVEKSITQVNAYVNGQQMKNGGGLNSFVKRIKKIDSPIQKLTINVIDRVGNKSSRVVYVEFNSTKQHTVIPRLNIMAPIKNGVITVLKEKHTIGGSVDFSSSQELHYMVSIFGGNNTLIDSMEMVRKSSFNWNFPVELENGPTVFRIELSNKFTVLADTTLVINYCKECIDTDPPVIASILVNGSAPNSSNRYVSYEKDVKIDLIYYDEGEVDSVFINNRLMNRDIRTNYRWYLDTLINHITNPDTFSFYAVDKSGHQSAKSKIIAGYNTSPYIDSAPDSVEHALSGRLYSSKIDIKDNDINDFVTYSIFKTDARGIFIDEKGTIKWTPGKSDAGFHTVEIIGEDRGGFTIFFSYVIYVSDTPLDTVKFITSRNEFPNLLPYTDSINIPLKVRGGTKPFVFEVTDRTQDNEKIPVNQLLPFFKWKPDSISDTGAHQFFIVVRDTLRLSDTLWPVIRVLPPNRDFEIKVLRWTGSRKSDSALDLSRNRADTLFFTINDPDNSQYERHTIEVTSGLEKYSITTDSGKFFIPLSHLARVSGRDSLVLNVKDKGNHVKRIVNRLDYGKSPLTATLLYPRNDTIIESKDVMFRWTCSDPDGESLKYHFTLQVIDGTFRVEKEVQDTFCSVSGLKKAGLYYWSVIASDSKSSISSLSGRLTCLPPDRVRIDTTVSKLPELIHCKTSIKAPIVIRNGYPPFSFKCSSPFIVNGDSLAWIADCNKTGAYKINLMVEDSVGNTDTYTFNTSVYGSDSLDLKIVNSIPRNAKYEIDLSDTLVKTVVCTMAIIDPDPSPPEKFVIDVYLGNLRQQYFNNYVGRTFLVSLKPDMLKTVDTLHVNVTDIDGHNKNLTEIIYYGE